MARNPKDHLQIPVMYAFREAHRAKDAKKGGMEYKDGERVLSERGSMRRRGANEAELKRNLEIDLVQLANTINMAAAADLDGLDYVRRSVLNFGLVDLSNMTSEDLRVRNLPSDLAHVLLNNEPRFVPETIEVSLDKDFDDVNQKLRFDIYAEMACKPVDVPLEFSAEIDVGSGKISFANVGKN